MRMRSALAVAGFGGSFAGLVALASCGSRTGLPGEEVADAAPADVTRPQDQLVEEPGEDAFDAFDAVEAIEEMPPIDVNRPDVPIVNPCPDAAATLIYVIGESNTLYSFDPADDAFTPIGTISCPGTGSATPFSMAVDREGVAYVVFTSGGLYRVSTKTAECKTTKYDPLTNKSVTFGMGFVAGVGEGGVGEAGEEEQLFVSLDVDGIMSNGELATIDTTTFKTTDIGFFSPTVEAAELTGTGDGRLFAFSPSETDGGSFIAQVDPTTAKVIARDALPGVVEGSGWAFGFWGGDFYTFTGMGPGGDTIVTRFDPGSKTSMQVATLSDTIVGAGVSTCAPAD